MQPLKHCRLACNYVSSPSTSAELQDVKHTAGAATASSGLLPSRDADWLTAPTSAWPSAASPACDADSSLVPCLLAAGRWPPRELVPACSAAPGEACAVVCSPVQPAPLAAGCWQPSAGMCACSAASAAGLLLASWLVCCGLWPAAWASWPAAAAQPPAAAPAQLAGGSASGGGHIGAATGGRACRALSVSSNSLLPWLPVCGGRWAAHDAAMVDTPAKAPAAAACHAHAPPELSAGSPAPARAAPSCRPCPPRVLAALAADARCGARCRGGPGERAGQAAVTSGAPADADRKPRPPCRHV